MNARTSPKAAVLRCAIYTRKSSDEGLEQSFNSLHAQREACEAYIKSQAHEGWTLRPTAYDDGGFSGGSMDRPGLKQLLADIEAGLVDVVLTYKVDRLTRSLHDFARIVEVFDRAGVSFVSITQAFNTTTSMGRLTLNVLLSFAQFEREVTGERIRDKIAASKAKGMWMGGVLPLGYDAGDHTLQINPVEADLVRNIFQRYLKLGSVHALRDELERQGVLSKAWVTKAGRSMGGRVFDRGALYHLLQNRHYLGEIRHRDLTYPGNHPPIVEAAVFEAVQKKLAKNRIKRRGKPSATPTAYLAGKIVDQAGRPYSPTFSYGRGARRYGYYVLTDVQQGTAKAKDTQSPPRIPAEALEAVVLGHLRRISGQGDVSWEALGRHLRRLEVRPDEMRLHLDRDGVFGEDHPDLALEDLQARLHATERAAVGKGASPDLVVVIPGRLQFRGGRTWCSQPRTNRRIDPTLVQALRAAHQVLKATGLAPDAISREAQAPVDAYSRKLCRLAFLSPAIQAAILEGRQPPGMTLAALINAEIPLAWEDQAAKFGV